MAEKFVVAERPAYKVSKSALNMLTKQWAIEHAKEGFTFVCHNPGVSQSLILRTRVDTR